MSGASGLWPIRFAVQIQTAISSLYSTNPRLANAFTGGCTFALGDLTAQHLEKKRSRSVIPSTESHAENQYDFYRAAQLGLLGVIMNGAFLFTWYTSLDKVIGSSRKSKIGVAAKVAADQFIYAPFSITTFFYCMSLRNTRDVSLANEEFVQKMRANFVATYFADCMLWPCSNFVNFRFVPLPYRPSFTAIIQFIWQTYLSYTSNSPSKETTRAIDSLTATAEIQVAANAP